MGTKVIAIMANILKISFFEINPKKLVGLTLSATNKKYFWAPTTGT